MLPETGRNVARQTLSDSHSPLGLDQPRPLLLPSRLLLGRKVPINQRLRSPKTGVPSPRTAGAPPRRSCAGTPHRREEEEEDGCLNLNQESFSQNSPDSLLISPLRARESSSSRPGYLGLLDVFEVIVRLLIQLR